MSRGRDALITSNVLAGYGLLHLPDAEAADVLSDSSVEQGLDWSVVATRQPWSETLDYLDTVTWPATRYVLFPLCDRWTVIVNNLRGGTDVADLLGHIRHRQAAMAVRVVDHDESCIVQNGFRVRQRYAVRMVSIQAGGVTTRSVTCADDGGRWVFETSGEPLPVEELFDYEARRKRDRFTRSNLDTLLRSIGARRVIAQDLAETRHFTLLAALPRNKEGRRLIESEALTTMEAADPARGYFTRGKKWVEHMETHATSVVADFGRAVLLNPAFEARCRPALDRARAQLGNEIFEVEMARALAGLRR